ncbi:hypothetical protein J4225_01305 [Candidatus Pacearchaeota archaeon]|nr:hypothetical protein [Candidatus Pacearchaeota archaeon]
MRLSKVKSTKRADGNGYYHKYTISPIPKEVAEKSGLINKNLKAKIEKGKIILEKE